MKKKEYMFLVLSMGMIMMLTGCGNEQKVPETPVAVETEVETEETKVGYEIIEVNKEYQAVTVTDTVLLDSSDAVTKIVDIEKDTYVTVYGDVLKDGVAVEYYAVELDDGTKGFIEGKHLNFNVAVENDYTENLEEIEGGDGEETTEEVTETETTETQPEEAFEPYQMYTNTSCNVRAQASKDSELVGTCVINTEVKVIGIEGDWSKVEYNGLQAFIKSSLLSKDKTEVKQSSNNSGNSSSQSNGGSQSNSGTSQPSQPDTSGDNQAMNDLLTDMFGNDGQGTGYDGGTTGDDGSGGGMNVQ